MRIKEIGIFALRDLLVVPVPPRWLVKVVSSPPPLLLFNLQFSLLPPLGSSCLIAGCDLWS